MISGERIYSKLKWTPQEEELLRVLKEERNIDSWKKIANQINHVFPDKNRSGKQCRERYMNYVRFGNNVPKSSGWTSFDDEQLFVKFLKYGAKWVQISKQIQGRSENCLKNRFYGAMRKVIRKINKHLKQKKTKQKKVFKADLLIRILEYSSHQTKQDENEQFEEDNFFEKIKKQMIRIAINPEDSSSSEQIESLIQGIIKFNALTKSSAQNKSNKERFQNSQCANPQIKQQNLLQKYEELNQHLKLDENKTEKQEKRKDCGDKNKHKIIQNLIIFKGENKNGQKIEVESKKTWLQLHNDNNAETYSTKGN